MTAAIQDLTPFFADRCWMFFLLASQASVGVILRRGPTKWWHVTLWGTENDTFLGGQWFHGQMYPASCDVSPDGSLFIYFAGKFRRRDVAQGYSCTWTAVSRPPYLTALALWPIGDTWGGQGVFVDNRTVLLATSSPSFGAKHHPDHPAGPLKVVEYCCLRRDDPRREVVPCWQKGWRGTLAPGTTKRYAAWRKTAGDLILQLDVDQSGWDAKYYGNYFPRPSRRRSLYTLYGPEGKPLASFEAHWADWDQQGRLIAAVGGRILEGRVTKNRGLSWRQLVAMDREQPSPMAAPDWARHW